MTLDPVIVSSLRAAFALLFLSAAVHKIADRHAFATTVGKYVAATPMAGPAAVAAVSVLVILAELVVVLACAKWAGPIAAAGAATLLFIYAAAMLFNLRRGVTLLDCGCTWGTSRQPVHAGLVLRNAVLALLALGMAAPVSDRALSLLDTASILAFLGVSSLLYAGINRLLAVPPAASEVR